MTSNSCYLCKGPSQHFVEGPDTPFPPSVCWTMDRDGVPWRGCVRMYTNYQRRRVKGRWETYEATPIPLKHPSPGL